MLEQKLQQLGMHIYMTVLTDVINLIPDFVKVIDELCAFKYYADVIKNDMDHDGNIGVIGLNDLEDVEAMKNSLCEFGVPCTIFETSVLDAQFRRFNKQGVSRVGSFSELTNGRYTIVFPPEYMQMPLSKEEVRAYLSKGTTNDNSALRLRPEDEAMLPPEGCTLIDLVLAEANLDKLRAQYHIKVNDKTKEKEQEEEQEQEEELERELGEGHETEEEKKNASVAPAPSTEIDDSVQEGANDASGEKKEKKKKEKKKGEKKENRSEFPSSPEIYSSSEHYNPSYGVTADVGTTSAATDVSAAEAREREERNRKEREALEKKRIEEANARAEQEKRVREAEAAKDRRQSASAQLSSTRIDGMSVEKNLAHDSIRHQDELKKAEEEKRKQEETNKDARGDINKNIQSGNQEHARNTSPSINNTETYTPSSSHEIERQTRGSGYGGASVTGNAPSLELAKSTSEYKDNTANNIKAQGAGGMTSAGLGGAHTETTTTNAQEHHHSDLYRKEKNAYDVESGSHSAENRVGDMSSAKIDEPKPTPPSVPRPEENQRDGYGEGREKRKNRSDSESRQTGRDTSEENSPHVRHEKINHKNAERYVTESFRSTEYDGDMDGRPEGTRIVHRTEYESKLTAGNNESSMPSDIPERRATAKGIHVDEYSREYVSAKSGAALDGSERTTFDASRDYRNVHVKEARGQRQVLFSSHGTEQAGVGRYEAVKEKASHSGSSVKSRAALLMQPVKQAIESAVEGAGTSGGNEMQKYLGTSSPVTRYITKGYNYGTALRDASQIMHDEDLWVKAYAISTGDTDLKHAKQALSNSVTREGLSMDDFHEKNIVDMQRTLDNAVRSHSVISTMSADRLQTWINTDGAALSDEIKGEVAKFKQALDEVENSSEAVRLTDEFIERVSIARERIEILDNEIGRLNREAANIMAKVTDQETLITTLKDLGYSDEIINKVKVLKFEDIKANGLGEVIAKEFDVNAIKNEAQALTNLKRLTNEGHVRTTGQLLMRMNNVQVIEFMAYMGIDAEARQEITKIGIRKVMNNPKLLDKVIKKLGDDNGAIKRFQGFLKHQNASPDSFRALVSSLSKKALKSAFGSSEGANSMWEHWGYASNAKRATQLGIKASLKVSERISSDGVVTRGLRAASHPAKFMIKKAAATKTGAMITNTRFARGLSNGFKATRRIVHAPGRIVGNISRRTARTAASAARAGARHVVSAVKGVAKAIHAAATAASAASTSAAAGGGAAAGGAAAGGAVAAGGWIVLAFVLVIALFIYIFHVKSGDLELGSAGNYQYAQMDPDFQAEILNELQSLNDGFQEQVNRAVTDRSFWSSSVGFSETDSVTQFESGAYTVHFRDDKGNELDHLDINNSKAILDMASQYCKYANWQKPGDNAPESQKTAYEQIKQYYLDYCKFLWVSTHQITIEEYRPGDSKYASEDNSGLTTDAQGICPQNGKQVWLSADFTRGTFTQSTSEKQADGNYYIEYVCGDNNGKADNGSGENLKVCSEVPRDSQYESYGEHAICSHPLEGTKDGWRIVTDASGNPQTQVHYICPENRRGGHKCTKCSSKDDKVYHYCGEICPSTMEVFEGSDSHKHTDYLWEYHCGGHMGAVVYITVGDVSRLASADAAKDIDVNDLSNYPDNSNDAYTYAETTESTEEGGETENEQGN